MQGTMTPWEQCSPAEQQRRQDAFDRGFDITWEQYRRIEADMLRSVLKSEGKKLLPRRF
jgi:hypothetical protein